MVLESTDLFTEMLAAGECLLEALADEERARRGFRSSDRAGPRSRMESRQRLAICAQRYSESLTRWRTSVE